MALTFGKTNSVTGTTRSTLAFNDVEILSDYDRAQPGRSCMSSDIATKKQFIDEIIYALTAKGRLGKIVYFEAMRYSETVPMICKLVFFAICKASTHI